MTFWSPVLHNLLEARTLEDEMVVADWLEERGMNEAAEWFRSTHHDGHFWRNAIAAVANHHPDIAPTERVLATIRDHAQHTLRVMRTRPNHLLSIIGAQPWGEVTYTLDSLDAEALVSQLVFFVCSR